MDQYRKDNEEIRTTCAEVAGVSKKARYKESSLVMTEPILALTRWIRGCGETCAVLLFECAI